LLRGKQDIPLSLANKTLVFYRTHTYNGTKLPHAAGKTRVNPTILRDAINQLLRHTARKVINISQWPLSASLMSRWPPPHCFHQTNYIDDRCVRNRLDNAANDADMNSAVYRH